ncbi:MAG: hypothetical protein HC848_08380 [Limnobacter sp.]|nr:hypothetical protein [Limnobacter sp.]
MGLTIEVKEGAQAINLGEVVGRNASFFASLVKNSGHVEATGVQFAENGTLRFVGTEGVVLSDTSALKASGGVVNIEAENGDALLNGRVDVSTQNGAGGRLAATGDRVALLAGASIHADGGGTGSQANGGQVHIGGGWQGKNDAVHNASHTVVQQGASISANAGEHGNGGEVVVWADDLTEFHGSISARGGSSSGNGGQVETSGKKALQATGRVEVSGSGTGNAGKYLLDPGTIRIVDSQTAQANRPNAAQGNQNNVFTSNIDGFLDSYLDVNVLASALEAGGSGGVEVVVTTSGAGNASEGGRDPLLAGETNPANPNATDLPAGSILVQAPIDVTLGTLNTATLVLDADGLISINAPITLNSESGSGSQFNVALNYNVEEGVFINAPIQLNSKATNSSLNLNPYSFNDFVSATAPGAVFTSGFGIGGSGGVEPFPYMRLNTLDGQFDADGTRLAAFQSPVEFRGVQGFLPQFYDAYSPFGSFGPVADLHLTSDAAAQGGAVASVLQLGSGRASSITVDSGSVLTLANIPLFQNAQFTASFEIGRLNVGQGAVVNAQAYNAYDPLDSGIAPGFQRLGDLNLAGTLNVFGASDFVRSFNTGNATLFSGGVLNIGPASAFKFQAGGSGSSGPVDFFAESGAVINLVGLAQPSAQNAGLKTNGAVLDVTGLGGVLDSAVSPEVGQLRDPQGDPAAGPNLGASSVGDGLSTTAVALDAVRPGTLQVNALGYDNLIQTDASVRNSLTIGPNVNITVAGAASLGTNPSGSALVAGLPEFHESLTLRTYDAFNSLAYPDSDGQQAQGPLSVLGTVNVQQGLLALAGRSFEGENSILLSDGQNQGSIQVAANAAVSLEGVFTTSGTINAINRQTGSYLGLSGVWNNDYTGTGPVVNPFAAGTIVAFDDLYVRGIHPDSGTTPARLDMLGTPSGTRFVLLDESFVTLDNISLRGKVDMYPDATLLLRKNSVLQNATVSMAGFDNLLVEANGNTAVLGGQALIESANQGNHLLGVSYVREFEGETPAAPPQNFTVGADIRISSLGNALNTIDTPEGLTLFGGEGVGGTFGASLPTFLIGQASPELVAQLEYNTIEGSSQTTLLANFDPNDNLILDGQPDGFVTNPDQLSSDCFSRGCLGVKAAQVVSFQGSISAGSRAISTPQDAFVQFSVLTPEQNIRLAQMLSDRIRFLSGTNVVTEIPDQLVENGPGSTLVFDPMNVPDGSSFGANGIVNDGTIQLNGNYSLVGGVSGTGSIENNGILTLNLTGQTISNNVVNNSSVVNVGTLTFGGTISGSGTVSNQGGLFLLNGAGFTGASFNNLGVVALNPGAAVSFGNFNQTGGNTNLGVGSLFGGNLNIAGGSLTGKGLVAGNLTVSGVHAPGNSPGAMFISGNYTLNPNGVLVIEFAGNGGQQGVDYDYIDVSGTAFLNGRLDLVDISGGNLQVNNVYAFFGGR